MVRELGEPSRAPEQASSRQHKSPELSLNDIPEVLARLLVKSVSDAQVSAVSERVAYRRAARKVSRVQQTECLTDHLRGYFE
jgi:hypothetical protein